MSTNAGADLRPDPAEGGRSTGAPTSHTARSASSARSAGVAGWGILGLLAMVGLILLATPGLDGIRMAIRATARTSLFFFLLAYVASAWWTLRPSGASRWILAHRRQWGWLMALSHTLHLVCIVAYAHLAPQLFYDAVPMVTWVTGTLAYFFIWSMGLTSFDRTARWLGRWLGPRAWSRLHTWGSHYIWLIFFLGNGKRIVAEPIYLLPTVPLVAVMAMRWLAVRRRKKAVASAVKAGSANAAPA